VPVAATYTELRVRGSLRDRTHGTTSSHSTLVRDASRACAPTAYSRRSQVDVIIVPTSRGAFGLDGVAHLAARLEVPLVALLQRWKRRCGRGGAPEPNVSGSSGRGYPGRLRHVGFRPRRVASRR
jgi:hypothetical protein